MANEVASPRRFLTSPQFALTATTLALTFWFFRFISRFSVNVLYWDQWLFLNPFFNQTSSLKQLFFEQWGPHREGVGLIADKILFPLTNWNTRAESFMIGGIIFVAMLVALVLKRALFGSWTYSDVAIPLMFLTLAQWATMVHTPNPAHAAFPLLMIMLYCLALLQCNRLLRYVLLLSLNFLLIYTGFGVFMGMVTLAVFALEIYWSVRGGAKGDLMLPVMGFIVAGASLGSFFHHYTFWPAVDCFVFPYHPISAYPWFMALMFWGFVGHPHHWIIGTVVGAALFIFAIVAIVAQLRPLLSRDRSSARYLVIFVLLAFSLLFVVNTAAGRVCLGREGAAASRYVTLMIPAFLAMYFCLLTFSANRVGKIAIGLFVLLLIPSALAVRNGVVANADGKRAWAACYRQREDIQYCDNSTNFKVDPYPDYDHLKEKLDYLKQQRLNLFAAP
jgi:hypothetical protein